MKQKMTRYFGISYASKLEAHYAAFFRALRMPFNYKAGEGFHLPETYREGVLGTRFEANNKPLTDLPLRYCGRCGTTWIDSGVQCPTCQGADVLYLREIAIKHSEAAIIDFSYHEPGQEPHLEPIPEPLGYTEPEPEPEPEPEIVPEPEPEPDQVSLGDAWERVLSDVDYTITITSRSNETEEATN